MYEPTSRLPLCYSNISGKISMGTTGNIVPVVWKINFLLFIKCLSSWDRHYSITGNEQDYRCIFIAEFLICKKTKWWFYLNKIPFNNDCCPLKDRSQPPHHRMCEAGRPLKVMSSKPSAQSRTSFWKSPQMETSPPPGQRHSITLTVKNIWCSEYPVFQFVPTASWKQDSLASYSEWSTPSLWSGHLLKGSTQILIYVHFELNLYI